MSFFRRLVRQPSWRHTGLVAIAVAALALNATARAQPAEESTAVATGLQTVQLSALPREAQTTYRLILAGGPFPYSQDGIVFGNREHLLPAQRRGYYHEYTVQTPGAHNRGARRIICGGTAPTQPDRCFYTDDHYASFKQVAP